MCRNYDDGIRRHLSAARSRDARHSTYIRFSDCADQHPIAIMLAVSCRPLAVTTLGSTLPEAPHQDVPGMNKLRAVGRPGSICHRHR